MIFLFLAPKLHFISFANDTALFYSNKMSDQLNNDMNKSLENIANWLK